MQKRSPFLYSGYKPYLLAIAAERGARSGFRSALARAAHCSFSYVSNVLNGDAQFSLEQAERISEVLGHSSEEADCFLLQVLMERAGTPSLRRRLASQLEALSGQKNQVKARIGAKQSLSERDRIKYYSVWYYSAVHVALSVPRLRNARALAEYFRLPIKKINTVLEFLVRADLAHQEGERFSIGPTFVHLRGDSEQIIQHHTNWRSQALSSLAGEGARDLHYSSVVSLSQSDVVAVKEQMLESLKGILARIERSKEEEVYALNLDFFTLGNQEGLL